MLLRIKNYTISMPIIKLIIFKQKIIKFGIFDKIDGGFQLG
jgi:hypothetical protein